MDIAIFATEVILAGGLVFLFLYVKGLPDRIHAKSLREFEYELSTELEKLKADLQEDLALLRISREQVQVHKIQEFTNFTDKINEFLSDSDRLDAAKADEEQRVQLKRYMINLGTRLFFFAGDSAVRQYIQWRKAGQEIDTGRANPERILYLYGQLMTEIRRDLGYQETECGPGDYLGMIITDWDESMIPEEVRS